MYQELWSAEILDQSNQHLSPPQGACACACEVRAGLRRGGFNPIGGCVGRRGRRHERNSRKTDGARAPCNGKLLLLLFFAHRGNFDMRIFWDISLLQRGKAELSGETNCFTI